MTPAPFHCAVCVCWAGACISPSPSLCCSVQRCSGVGRAGRAAMRALYRDGGNDRTGMKGCAGGWMPRGGACCRALAPAARSPWRHRGATGMVMHGHARQQGGGCVTTPDRQTGCVCAATYYSITSCCTSVERGRGTACLLWQGTPRMPLWQAWCGQVFAWSSTGQPGPRLCPGLRAAGCAVLQVLMYVSLYGVHGPARTAWPVAPALVGGCMASLCLLAACYIQQCSGWGDRWQGLGWQQDGVPWERLLHGHWRPLHRGSGSAASRASSGTGTLGQAGRGCEASPDAGCARCIRTTRSHAACVWRERGETAC